MHVIIAVLYLPLAIFIMRKFSVKAKIQETDLNVSRVLMITNIPKRACDIDDLYKHFRYRFEALIYRLLFYHKFYHRKLF